MKTISDLILNNKKWADGVKQDDSDYFNRLAQGQQPKFLWIGCSDSRVPPEKLLGLEAGDIFVHRNIANVVAPSDLNTLSVLEYAVNVLKVKHILVCGHYGCGGVMASMQKNVEGIIDNWLNHIRNVSRLHAVQLERFNGMEKVDHLCELNVLEQVKNVCNTRIVKKVWEEGNEISVHGLIFDIKNGEIKDMHTTIDSLEKLDIIMGHSK